MNPCSPTEGTALLAKERIHWIRSGLLAIALASLVATGFAAKTARVFVDSEASVSYDESKNTDEGSKYETFVFMKGNFYGRDFKDKSLRTPSFEEIIGSLAENMKDRNYYPSAIPDDGDLLIVVHYGSTSVEQDWEDLFPTDSSDPYADTADGLYSDPEESEYTGFSENYSESFEDLQDLARVSRNNVAKHKTIMDNRELGIGRALSRKNINRNEEFNLRVELEDERYFIILMAYDFQKLKATKETELLWTTRFSVPAIGTNFVDAYPALARAARPYFGTSLEKYAKSNTHFGTGSVDIGTLETVGVEEDSDAATDSEE